MLVLIAAISSLGVDADSTLVVLASVLKSVAGGAGGYPAVSQAD